MRFNGWTQEEHTIEHIEINTNTFSENTLKWEWQWVWFQEVSAQSVHRLLHASPCKLGYTVLSSRWLAGESVFICKHTEWLSAQIVATFKNHKAQACTLHFEKTLFMLNLKKITINNISRMTPCHSAIHWNTPLRPFALRWEKQHKIS